MTGLCRHKRLLNIERKGDQINMRKYICGVIISVLIISVSPCNYIYAESVDVSEEETVIIDQNNPNPVIFDGYGLQIQWDSCKYSEGASDITVNLHITNIWLICEYNFFLKFLINCLKIFWFFL